MVSPSLEGTYQLVRRELPDGRNLFPPALKGMLTYTREFRNFSVVWVDDNGKYYSECYVARYALSDKEYMETSEYLIVDDQIGGKGISYDLSNNTAKAPAAIEGGHVRFALPQPFEQAFSIVMEFDGANFRAVVKDLFVDHWDKVA